MTRYQAAIEAEELLGFPCIAKRIKHGNKDRRFLVGSPEKNVAFWAASFEDIILHLKRHPELKRKLNARPKRLARAREWLAARLAKKPAP